MSDRGVDPLLLHAWLAARSVARGLPPPVPDHGGFRVDTRSDAEICRWVFPQIGPGLETLARSVDRPRHFLKLCGTADELQAVLPPRWTLHAPSYFMRANAWIEGCSPPEDYKIETNRADSVVQVRITSTRGALAASGYAADTRDAFIYDRIVTAPEHRRKGLGRALMTALRAAKRYPASPELLVATEDGRALYTMLGWETVSSYSTASIVNP